MHLWLTRASWLALPLGCAAAIGDVSADWDAGPRTVALGLAWAAWGIGIVALLAPHPMGLTAIRTIAPAFAVAAVVAVVAGDVATAAAIGALAVTVVAAVLVALPACAREAAAGIAYGDEVRQPLRSPPGLYLGPIPLARALAVAGIVTGPVLLADGSVAAGAVALLIGFPASWLALRSLHTLSTRWLILVPAGVAVVDRMTLADPVLFVRSTIRSLQGVDGTAPVPEGAVDLRLGATAGTVVITTDGTVDIARISGRRRHAETLRPERLLVAIAAPASLLDEAARRRVPVTAA
ncbi:MAG: hypothetical protein R6X23_11365 [Acidimicrobiia bacterium]